MKTKVGGTWGVAAMVCSAGCWGSATVMSKAALESCAPLPLLLVQLGASVLFLWMLALGRADRGRVDVGILRPGMLGVLEPGLAYLFGIVGLERSSASTASLITGSEPLMVLTVGAVFYHQRLTALTVRYALLGFVGLTAVVGASQGQGTTNLSGALWVVAGTLCAAFYVVFSARVSGRFDPLHLAATQQSVALLFIFILVVSQVPLADSLASMSTEQLLFAMLSGIIQYGLALWAYLVALQRMNFVRAAIFLNLIPLFGILSAYLFLDEKLMELQWLGAGVVIFALLKSRHA